MIFVKVGSREVGNLSLLSEVSFKGFYDCVFNFLKVDLNDKEE